MHRGVPGPRRAIFKFESAFSCSHATSLLLFISFFSTIFILSILYKDKSTQIQDFPCFTKVESKQVLYVLAMIKQFKPANKYGLIFLHLLTFSNNDDIIYDIDGEVVYQWNQASTQMMHSTSQSILGQYMLFSTQYFGFDSILIQAHLTVNVSDVKEIQIKTICSQEVFGRYIEQVQIIFSVISLFVLIVYIGMVFFISFREIHHRHIYTMVSLFLSFVSNYPINKAHHSPLFLIIDLVALGVFKSVIFIINFVLVYVSNGGKEIKTVLTISSLFTLSQILCEFTSDSYLLNEFFDNNIIAWLFFVSVLIISQASMIIFILYGDFILLMTKRTSLNFSYILISLMSLTSIIGQLFCRMNDGYESASMAFFSNNFTPTLISLFLADAHWPIYAPIPKPGKHHDVEHPLRFEEAGDLPI